MSTSNKPLDTKVFKDFKQPPEENENIRYYAVTLSNLLISDEVVNTGYPDDSLNEAVCNIKCLGSPKSGSAFKTLNITMVEKYADFICDTSQSWPLGVYRRRINGLDDEYDLLINSRIQFINTILLTHANDRFAESELFVTVPKEPVDGKFCYPILAYRYQIKTI